MEPRGNGRLHELMISLIVEFPRMYQRWYCALILSCTLLIGASTRAQTIGYESFDYVAGGAITGSNGSGWSDAWNGTGIAMIISTGGLTSPGGQLPTTGNGAQMNSGSNLASLVVPRQLSTSLGGSTSERWVSFLVKPNKTGIFDFAGISLGSSGGNIAFVGYQQTSFIINTAGGGGTTITTGTATSGTTVFLVLRIRFAAGSVVDTLTLYVNPTPGLGSPDVSASSPKQDLDLGTFTQIALAAGRGFSANPAIVDEIRCGYTYADVAPTTILPIQLSSFTAHFLLGTQHVILRWTTVSETNNYGFEVQRRRASEPAFATLPHSFIPGHGTTLEEHHYSYTDSMVQSGVWQYRLRQIDLDGTLHYTEPVQVEVTTDVAEHSIPAELSLLQNYPNPFNPSTVIGFNLPKASQVSLIVYDLLGREVETLVHGELPAGNHSSIWTPKYLAGGAYIYCLRTQGVVMVRRLMLLR